MNSYLEPVDEPSGLTLREQFESASNATSPGDRTTDDCRD
jgi:hypothetical protein